MDTDISIYQYLSTNPFIRTRMHRHKPDRNKYNYQFIGPMSRVFANGPRDSGSISGLVIPKTQKMVLDAALLSTQHYKVRIKGKWSNPGKGVAPHRHLGVVAIENGAFR